MEPPLTWKHLTTFAIGGLENIGFAKSGNIVVLSSQGKGIISSQTGQKLFRDPSRWWESFAQAEQSILGFGGEKDDLIKLSGLHTQDYLKKQTIDGWMIYAEKALHGSIPISKFYLKHPTLTNTIFIGEDGPCELRAFGFSDDESNLIIATSCDLVIWRRT